MWTFVTLVKGITEYKQFQEDFNIFDNVLASTMVLWMRGALVFLEDTVDGNVDRESPGYTMLPAQLHVFRIVCFIFKPREVIIVCLWLCMKIFLILLRVIVSLLAPSFFGTRFEDFMWKFVSWWTLHCPIWCQVLNCQLKSFLKKISSFSKFYSHFIILIWSWHHSLCQD